MLPCLRVPQIQIFNSPELVVKGVSSTFGNAATPATTVATQELLDRFFPEYRMTVAQGALGPNFETTEAVEALSRALRRNEKLVGESSSERQHPN